MTGTADLALRRITRRQRVDEKSRLARCRYVVREDAVYLAEIPDGQLAEHARINPGVLRIEDMEGEQLWPATLKAVRS